MMTPDNLVLRPNCLLTRSPLAFISGPRSLFAPQKMATDLQEFVQAHGYQTESPWLPFRSTSQRKAFLHDWLLKNKSRSFHFFMAADTWNELQMILEENFHPFSTITIINRKENTSRSHLENVELHSFAVEECSSPILYQLHQLFCKVMGTNALNYEETLLAKDPTLYDRFLDHCIDLAENEYKDLTSRM
jgi:hypothetical protein